MSRLIAVHVVAGILFVAVGTADAQESIPRPDVVEARDTLTSPVADIEGDVGVTVAIAPNIHRDDPNDNIEGRQNPDRSPQGASDSPQPTRGNGAQMRSFRVWPAAGERLKPRRLRVTIQQPRPVGIGRHPPRVNARTARKHTRLCACPQGRPAFRRLREESRAGIARCAFRGVRPKT